MAVDTRDPADSTSDVPTKSPAVQLRVRSDAQRKPGSSLTQAARNEVDCLLSRLARKDKRADLAARLNVA